MTDVPTYVLERNFDAPRALVWKAWTDPELLARWYGPGVETIIHALSVREGGAWLCEMRWGDNANFQRADYTEVVEPERLVWLHTVTDADWQPAPNPMMPDWPRTLLTVVTFEARGDKTFLRLTWTPHKATDAEIACFAGAMSGLDQGWGKGMEILADVLAELME
ncbi:SRPBCC family protein [Oceanomicrobium pacificus]|uniref:SRPBCC domain-containing protein n=1 Tax=Oceanomicrobium pacificus TaxID=2692916 RepID=A0A6B0TTN5_9RHOB|nr:SRPBCC domain-containing protein [Oceanomicrobium pacificus]MXU64594.1 SRPBCC domain-containing protein [Oceanomicrobium pacificus]